MSLPAPYSEVYYEGTGSRVEFPFGSDFNAISADYVKCIVYLEDGTPIVPTYTVDMSVGSITISALTMPDSTILTAPPVGSQVRVFRDVPEAQNVTASQLQSYTAKQLEVALDAIVAMIQEVSYTVDHKTLRLTETQRDVALQELKEANDGCLVYWDFTNRKLVVTDYPQQDVVRCVNGLFFRLRTDPDTQEPYLQWSTDNSDWHSIDVDAVRALAQSAYDLADSAYNLASTTRGELNAHKALRNNPHETSMNNLIDTNFNNLVSGQFLQFNGINWVNVDYNTTVTWGGIIGNIDDQPDLKNALDAKVSTDGSSTMTGVLKMRATSSFQCAIAPFWDGVGFYKLNSDDSVTLIASIEDPDGLVPWVTNTYNIGSSLKKWKNLYLGGKVYVATINAGSDITVPNSAGEMLVNSATNSTSISIYGTPASGINTINIGRYTNATGVNSIMVGNYATAGEGAMAFGNGAEAAKYGFAYLGKATANYAYQIGRGTNSESYTLYVGWGTNENYKMLDGTTGFIPDARLSSNIARMSDVELAARSGRMITDQGVWYAKMYAATVPPAAENGTNYADFSQVDGDNNPIIVIYERQSGVWVQTEIITPPAEYDGYVPITSKIWDIAEQTDQQGGRILWNHTSKEFTPYPLIISLNNITGSTLTDCTVIMPYSIAANSAVNAGWVINRQGWQDIEDYAHGSSATTVILEDDKSIYLLDNITQNLAITLSTSSISVTAGNAKTFELHLRCTGTPTITWNGIDAWLVNSETTPVEADKTSIFVVRVQQMPNDVGTTVVANYGGAY